ncbi:MAG: DUF115 domain-containing protein [Lachnospiraceae bacterium]|nr:DUF115 domain-containing protein [Lachnospiraceae bacterium]
MKRSEVEQRISEINFRISQMEKMLSELKESKEELQKQIEDLSQSEYEEVDKKCRSLSDELYAHIGKQDAQIIQHIDNTSNDLAQRIQTLSDDVYEYIGKQHEQIIQHVDNRSDDLTKRIQTLSDDVYQHIANQNEIRDEAMEKYKKLQNDAVWMTTYGFDNMIAELQLTAVEQACPGNRKRLEALKDTHLGEKCFVIGNGPSLRAEDLDKLKEKGIFCFAAKGIYNIFDETDWRPDIWGASDLEYVRLKKEDINCLEGFPKLVCVQTYTKLGILLKDVIYYPFIQAERTPRFFNRDILRGIHFYGTITAKLINIAIYMGFSEIYLLGCDNSSPVKKDENGVNVLDLSKKNNF